MAEPIDIMMLTYEVFKPRAEAHQSNLGDTFQDLLRDPSRFEINQLVQCAEHVSSDPDLLNFTLGLLSIKVSHESPLPNSQGLEIFERIKLFIYNNLDNKEIIVNCYSSALIQEIASSNSANLKNWAAVITKLYNLGGNVEAPKKRLAMRYTSECYGLMTKMNQSPTKVNILDLILCITEVEDNNIDIASVKSICLCAVCEYIINENDLRGICRQIGEPVNLDLEFAADLLSRIRLFTDVSADFQTSLSFITSKIDSLQPKNVKIVKKPVGDEKLLPILGFDPSLIAFEDHPICSRTSGNINVSIYRGTLPDNSMVVVKTYTAVGQSASLENLNAVQEEIKILTIASNRASKDNCFIKFFGAGTNEKSMALYMEAHKYNLMDLITDWKNQNFTLPSTFLESWIVSLIHSFQELANLKIAHGDIKPHNIIVTDDWKLKIIDFGISKIGQEIEATVSQTGTYLIQGTKGYMAPELEEFMAKNNRSGSYKPGKADIFSLGMTILQIITYDDLTTLNMKQNNKMLLEKVAGLKVSEWIKQLLAGMLEADRAKRLSFNKCIRFIPITDTII